MGMCCLKDVSPREELQCIEAAGPAGKAWMLDPAKDFRSRGGSRLFKDSKPEDVYEFDAVDLGQGTFGKVRRATSRRGGPVRAVKEVRKSRGQGQAEGGTSKAMMLREFDALVSLDHPNIVKLYEVLEDHVNMYLVTEYCAGGELYHAIARARSFSERQAACVMQQVLRGVAYMHAQGICHRDLKPENFLLDSQGGPIELCTVKIIDFGCAWSFRGGETSTDRVGSETYMAPEVINGRHNQSCDLWSCGVTAYIMLCGSKPYRGRVAICSADLRFGPEWASISADATDVIRRLLTRKPEARLTAEQALRHRWIEEGAPQAMSAALPESILENLRDFVKLGALKKVALNVIAKHLGEKEIEALRDKFLSLDKNRDGTLSMAELQEGLGQSGGQQMAEKIQEVVAAMDINGNGTIDYTEFIASTLEQRLYHEEGACWAAFRAFDQDGSGAISRDELQKVLADKELQALMGSWTVEQVFEECDHNNDGQIQFAEFLAVMRGGTSSKPP